MKWNFEELHKYWDNLPEEERDIYDSYEGFLEGIIIKLQEQIKEGKE